MAHQHAWDARALDEAVLRGYVVARGPASFAPRVWRAWCRDERRACLIVHRSKTRARAELDLRPAGWRLTDAGAGRIAAAAAARGIQVRLTAVDVRPGGARRGPRRRLARDPGRSGQHGGDVMHRRGRGEASPVRGVEPELAEDPRVQALVDAVVACGDDRALLLRFLRDLFVAQDLLAAADRWTAARALLGGASQGRRPRRRG